MLEVIIRSYPNLRSRNPSDSTYIVPISINSLDEEELTDSEEYVTFPDMVPGRWRNRDYNAPIIIVPEVKSKSTYRRESTIQKQRINTVRRLPSSHETNFKNHNNDMLKTYSDSSTYLPEIVVGRSSTKESIKGIHKKPSMKFKPLATLNAQKKVDPPTAEYLLFPPYKQRKSPIASILGFFRLKSFFTPKQDESAVPVVKNNPNKIGDGFRIWGLGHRCTESPPVQCRETFGPIIPTECHSSIPNDVDKRSIYFDGVGINIAPKPSDVALVTLQVTRRPKTA